MASKCEDHMDLGGFLQTYVLGNPFQNPATQAVTALPSRIVPPTPDIIAENAASLKQRVNENRAVSPNLNFYQNGLNTMTSKDNGEGPQNAGTLLGVSVETTPSLGHIGSNASYANLLRKRKVADMHRPLQDWLLKNYKYSPEVPAINYCLYNNQILLKEVQSEFATMSSIILSRVVKFTFPNCSKIINKTGTYWLGLLRKPEPMDCTYIMAANALKEFPNWYETIKAFCLQAASDTVRLASLLYWRDGAGQKVDLVRLAEVCKQQDFKGHIDPLQNATPDAAVELTSSESQQRKSNQFVPGFDSNCSLENGEEILDESDTDNTGKNRSLLRPSRHGRKRKKCTPVKRRTQSFCDDEQSKVLGEIGPSELIDSLLSSADAGAVSSGSRSASVSPLCSRFVKCDPDAFGSLGGAADPDQSVENGTTESQTVKVRVKEEPSDITYALHNGDHAINAGQMSAKDMLSRDENENCDFDDQSDTLSPRPTVPNGIDGPKGDSANDLKTGRAICDRDDGDNLQLVCPEGELPSYLICLAENRHLKSSLRSHKMRIDNAVKKNRKLESDLVNSREEIDYLNGQLSRREKHLSDLARDFLDLNEKFQALARKFQSALRGSVETNQRTDSELLNLNISELS